MTLSHLLAVLREHLPGVLFRLIGDVDVAQGSTISEWQDIRLRLVSAQHAVFVLDLVG